MFGDVIEKFLRTNGEDYESLINGYKNNEKINQGLININKTIEFDTFSFIGKARENILMVINITNLKYLNSPK